jgi:hypothetical protein
MDLAARAMAIQSAVSVSGTNEDVALQLGAVMVDADSRWNFQRCTALQGAPYGPGREPAVGGEH